MTHGNKGICIERWWLQCIQETNHLHINVYVTMMLYVRNIFPLWTFFNPSSINSYHCTLFLANWLMGTAVMTCKCRDLDPQIQTVSAVICKSPQKRVGKGPYRTKTKLNDDDLGTYTDRGEDPNNGVKIVHCPMAWICPSPLLKVYNTLSESLPSAPHLQQRSWNSHPFVEAQWLQFDAIKLKLQQFLSASILKRQKKLWNL